MRIKEWVFNEKVFKIVFLILVSLITIFHRLDESPLGYDDAHYAQRAKDMLKNRDFLYIKHKFGEEILLDNKPPMVYWFLSLSGKIFGFKNWSMRVVSGVFGFLTIIIFFLIINYFTRSFEFGFWSAFILNFTQQFIYYSRTATPEIIFNFFFWSAIFCFYIGVEKEKPIFIYLFGIFLGLAVMTRQVFGLMILVIIFGYLLLIKKTEFLLDKNFILAIFVSIIIFSPWHLYMIFRYGKNFINNYFGILARYSFSREADWYEYIKKIFETYWPWLPFLVIGIVKLKKLEPDLKKFLFLFLVSIIIYVGVLHIPKFKAAQYLVVMYIPFAVVSSFGLISVDKSFIIRKILIVLGVILPIIWLSFPVIPNTLDSNEYKELKKSFEAIKKIDKGIFTLSNSEYWHFKNGILFYLDKNIVGLEENELINSMIRNDSKNYYILKWKDFNEFTKKYILSEKLVIISSQTESVFFTTIK
ncbi:MAG: glycosyltransferase family 39 protein [Elusimicrobiota bacterium]|nr:glycosyltransferase family 39 protein [Endomicrobiia bacterium]MDW8165931.1 glycosyltransferase family 39 protein [Elusimicrobiota bacterium]